MLSIARRSGLQNSRLHRQTLHQLQPFSLARLLSSLAVLEQRDGALQNSSLCAITAAQKLGSSITGFVAGSNIKALAEAAAKVKGVEKIIIVENGAYDRVRTIFLFSKSLPGFFVALGSF